MASPAAAQRKAHNDAQQARLLQTLLQTRLQPPRQTPGTQPTASAAQAQAKTFLPKFSAAELEQMKAKSLSMYQNASVDDLMKARKWVITSSGVFPPSVINATIKENKDLAPFYFHNVVRNMAVKHALQQHARRARAELIQEQLQRSSQGKGKQGAKMSLKAIAQGLQQHGLLTEDLLQKIQAKDMEDKHHMLAQLPAGLWRQANSQASSSQLPTFNAHSSPPPQGQMPFTPYGNLMEPFLSNVLPNTQSGHQVPREAAKAAKGRQGANQQQKTAAQRRQSKKTSAQTCVPTTPTGNRVPSAYSQSVTQDNSNTMGYAPAPCENFQYEHNGAGTPGGQQQTALTQQFGGSNAFHNMPTPSSQNRNGSQQAYGSNMQPSTPALPESFEYHFTGGQQEMASSQQAAHPNAHDGMHTLAQAQHGTMLSSPPKLEERFEYHHMGGQQQMIPTQQAAHTNEFNSTQQPSSQVQFGDMLFSPPYFQESFEYHHMGGQQQAGSTQQAADTNVCNSTQQPPSQFQFGDMLFSPLNFQESFDYHPTDGQGGQQQAALDSLHGPQTAAPQHQSMPQAQYDAATPAAPTVPSPWVVHPDIPNVHSSYAELFELVTEPTDAILQEQCRQMDEEIRESRLWAASQALQASLNGPDQTVKSYGGGAIPMSGALEGSKKATNLEEDFNKDAKGGVDDDFQRAPQQAISAGPTSSFTFAPAPDTSCTPATLSSVYDPRLGIAEVQEPRQVATEHFEDLETQRLRDDEDLFGEEHFNTGDFNDTLKDDEEPTRELENAFKENDDWGTSKDNELTRLLEDAFNQNDYTTADVNPTMPEIFNTSDESMTITQTDEAYPPLSEEHKAIVMNMTSEEFNATVAAIDRDNREIEKAAEAANAAQSTAREMEETVAAPKITEEALARMVREVAALFGEDVL